MRIRNSIINFLSGVGSTLISNLLTFISRTIFIQILGSSYLGVNGLLTNVLSMLSLAELGIGTAINFSLYKPLAEKDDEKIVTLMAFYKKAYRIIGILVFIVGLVLMMFLDFFIKDAGDVEHIKLIFLIYLINTSYSYFMTYKVTLLNADQKGYLLAKVNIFFNFITIIAQIMVLNFTHNYILYLLTNMLILFLQRLYTNNKITKLYPVLEIKTTNKLPKEELDIIIKNVKAMMFHKLGDYCINGTDNIIISTFINISVVGIYSNYNMIITMVNGFIILFFNSITASMGHLIATESDKRKLEVFQIINFIGFWFFGFATIAFYNLLNPFIELWLGKEYLISRHILVIVLLNYYLTGMRVPVHTVKAAAGLYDEDKYTPLIQSVVNLSISIILVQKWGLAGVFMGTLVSSIVLPCWQRPYIIYKYVFNKSSIEYYKQYLIYFSVVMVTLLGVSWVCDNYLLNTTYTNFLLRVIVCAVIPNIIFILIFNKTLEFQYLVSIIKESVLNKCKSLNHRYN